MAVCIHRGARRRVIVSFSPEKYDVGLGMLMMLFRNRGTQECFWVVGGRGRHEGLKEPPRNLKAWIEVVTKRC